MKKYIYLFILSFFFNSNVKSQAFSLDTTFNINYSFYAPGSSAKVCGLNSEPDGKLMIYGEFGSVYEINDVLRVYADGTLDTSWNFMGGEGILFVERLGNEYITENGNFGKVNYNGQITDTAWNNNLLKADYCGSYNYPYIFQDGSVLVGSDSSCNLISTKKRSLQKFLPDGNIDTNFRNMPNGPVLGVVKYSSDKFLLYGGGNHAFTMYDTIPIIRLCRIDSLGNLDTTFKSIFTNGEPRPVYIQNDGKIIVIGGFTINNFNTIFNMVRLNPDGSLDTTFNNFNSAVYPDGFNCVCPTSDNGYLIGGLFTQYQGYLRNNICKTDLNGFIDTTYFNGEAIDSVLLPSLGIPPYVLSIEKGTNDTYYVMGWFTYYNGVHVNPIIRLKGLSDGINEIKQEKGIVKIYPNPSKDNLTIETNSNTEQRIEIINLMGQTIYTSYINNKKATVNTSAFPSGVYILKLYTDKETVVKKFVKE